MRIILSLALIDLRLLEVKFLFYDCTIAYSLLNWNEWHNFFLTLTTSTCFLIWEQDWDWYDLDQKTKT